MFDLPVDCQVGKTCIVQNYVDDDAGPAARDYRCGSLTYDGHKGTDIRITDLRLYKDGVVVRAAAAGKVRAVRDGMPDGARVPGKEAGNSVVVDHGNGWVTQYAHMRPGSVAVHPGEHVTAGQRLGVVGFSGNTEFPHLHFEVRHGGTRVDPFVGVVPGEPCQPGPQPLWDASANTTLEYTATGLLAGGLAGEPPKLRLATVDPDAVTPLTASSPAVVFWVQVYGTRAGDVEEQRLFAPDGGVLTEHRRRLPRNQAQLFSYIGKRRGEAPWPAGVYRGEYALYHEGKRVLFVTREQRLGSH